MISIIYASEFPKLGGGNGGLTEGDEQRLFN
jgi:hypothetical protein